jgi:hypothetical protein
MNPVIYPAVRVVFSLFQKWFPAKAKISTVENRYADETLSAWWGVLNFVLCMSVIAGIFFGLVTATRSLNAFIARLQGPSEFLLLPTDAWWYLYGGFTALCLCWFIVSPILGRLMGRERLAAWVRRYDKSSGFDGELSLRAMVVVLLLPFTLAFIPSLGCHTRFSNDAIGIQTYGHIQETRYSYSDIKTIAIVDGKDPRIVIVFYDGRRWSTRDSLRDPEPVNTDLASFIARKSGKALIHVETQEDVK